jgi:hypothetical protein
MNTTATGNEALSYAQNLYNQIEASNSRDLLYLCLCNQCNSNQYLNLLFRKDYVTRKTYLSHKAKYGLGPSLVNAIGTFNGGLPVNKVCQMLVLAIQGNLNFDGSPITQSAAAAAERMGRGMRRAQNQQNEQQPDPQPQQPIYQPPRAGLALQVPQLQNPTDDFYNPSPPPASPPSPPHDLNLENPASYNRNALPGQHCGAFFCDKYHLTLPSPETLGPDIIPAKYTTSYYVGQWAQDAYFKPLSLNSMKWLEGMQPGSGDGGLVQRIGRGTLTNDPNASVEEKEVHTVLGQVVAEMLLLRMQQNSSQEHFTHQAAFLQQSPIVKDEFKEGIGKHADTYPKAVRFLEGLGYSTTTVK